jgi:hydrogenase maturation protease
MESWEGFDRVIIVDAVCSGSPAGTIHRVNGRSLSLELERLRSSHSYGVADAVRLAQELGRMPKHLVLFGLEGAEFGFGQNLSSQVEASLPVLVERIRDELACVGGETGVS